MLISDFSEGKLASQPIQEVCISSLRGGAADEASQGQFCALDCFAFGSQ